MLIKDKLNNIYNINFNSLCLFHLKKINLHIIYKNKIKNLSVVKIKNESHNINTQKN